MFCCLPVVVYVLGCVLMRRLTGSYVQNRRHTEKPKKSSYPLPPEKNTLGARHARYSAQIELKPRPQVPDGLPVSTYLAFWLKVLERRGIILNRPKIHKYTYTYKAPLRGVGCSPRGDAS